MSFLKINNWEIPIVNCKLQKINIGSKVRAHSGGILSDSRAIKRKWNCVTAPMKEIDALALIGILEGQGCAWTFEGDYYSDKGHAPDTANGIGYYPIKATGGYSKFNSTALETDSGYNVLQRSGKFGTWSGVPAEHTITNICTTAQRGSDHTVFSAVDGATLSTDTNYYLLNTQSVKCITSGAVNGTRGGMIASTTGAALTNYYGSVWVYATSNTDVRITMRDATNAIYSTPFTQYIPASIWVRIRTHVGGYLTSGAIATPTIELLLEEDVADDAITIYTDGWQIETVAAGRATDSFNGSPFADPVITGTDTIFNLNFFKHDALSIAWWSGSHDTWGEKNISTIILYNNVDGYNAGSFSPNSSGVSLFNPGGTPDQVAAKPYSFRGHADDTLIGTAVEDSDGFSHWVFTMRNDVETGETNYTLYLNGAVEDSGTAGMSSAYPIVTDINRIRVDNWGYAPIDDLIIVPYTMSPDQVAGLYTLGESSAQQPSFHISGDIIAEDNIRCQSNNIQSAYVKAQYTNEDATITWHNNLYTISFDLLEV